MVSITQNMENNRGNKLSRGHKRKVSSYDSPPEAKKACTDDGDLDETFNATEFIFLLKNRETTMRGLEKFIKSTDMYPNAPGNVDIVLEYFKLSEDGEEVLTLLQIHRLPPSVISAVFNVLRCILVRVADDLVAYKKLAYSIAQNLLTVHMEVMYKMLDDVRKPNSVKSTLKLLTVIVVLSENSARNVLNKFDFSNSHLLNTLFEWRNVLDEQDIRTCFLIFLMSFLMTGSQSIIHDFVCKHDVISKIFAGLRVDKFAVIELVLPLIQEKVVKNEAITKSEKVKVFSAEVLAHLARVYNWLGPNKWKMAHKKVLEFQEVEQSPTLEAVRNTVHQLLLELCTSPKNGIIFFDKTFGTSGRDQNRAIRLFLQHTHVMPFFEDLYLKELIMKIFQVCPEQMQPFLMQVQNSTVPRSSLKWIQCMDFLENILEILPDIPLPLKTSRKIPVKKLLDLVTSVLLPPSEILQSIILSIGHKNLLIRHRCLQYLLKLMKKFEVIIQYCTSGMFLSESKVFTKADVELFSDLFTNHVKRVLPTVKTIFESWQEMSKEKFEDEAAMKDVPEVDLVDHVILIEQTLCLYQSLQLEAFSDFPIIENIFDKVQKLYQTWKQQRSDVAVIVPKMKSDKVSYQQTRVGLYLLKLLGGTDARKIPWNKKNEDGQPLLYFLLDILLTLGIDHQLLSITKQLICQLLFHSCLFDCNEMELHLWMDRLIKCSYGENSERKEELLKFVATVYTHYICNPQPYMEKIFEVVSEASVMEMGADTNSDLVSTSTVDDFIDRMNILDDEELGLNEQPTEENEEQSPIKLPFSPLIIVAMKEIAQKSDTEIKPLKNYLQSVLIDLFHSQPKPIPLSILLTEERKQKEKQDWISKRIVSYVKSWLPSCKKTKKEKTIVVEEYKNERSSVLLQLFYQNGKHLIGDSGFVTLLFKSVNGLNVSEILRLAQQSLLYIQARLSQIEQVGLLEDQNLSILQLNFKFLKKTVKHLFRQCQDQAKSNTSLAEGSEDFQILQIETYSVDRMLSEVLNFLSQQNAIQRWFLAIEPGFPKDSLNIKADKFKILSSLVTKELTSVFSEFPKTSNKELLSSYCIKIITYLKECLLLVSKSQVPDNLAFTVLKELIPYIDFSTVEEAVKLLLRMPPEVLLSETNTLSQILTKLLGYLIQNCKTFLLEEESLKTIYSLLVHSESTGKLLTICKTLFESKPFYCLSCPSNTFIHLLTSASPEHLHLAIVLMTSNVALDQVFVQWVLDNKNLKKNVGNYLTVCISWCKCQKTLPTDKSKKCLRKISKAFCKYLCAWMTENNAESFDTASHCQENYLQLLQQFARLQAPGYKHKPSFDSFNEILNSNQTRSPTKLKIFLALIQWAESIGDQSVAATRCRLEVCLKNFLNSVQTRAGTPEDKELELQLISYLEKYMMNLPSEYDDLILSNWTAFIRNSLRIYYSNAQVLRLVGHLIPKVYAESNSGMVLPNLKELHQMLICHSDFIPIILGYESQMSKVLLIDILLMVIERQPDCCAESHLYVLMGAYGATLSTCDQKLLKIIYLYEKNGIDFAKFRPFLWGVKVIETYELSKQETTLNKLPSTDRIFELIDADKMMKSILHFPVKRKLTPLEVAPAQQWKSIESCYDPCFILPVFSHLLASYNKLRILHFMLKNCLGFTFAALSSHDYDVRAAGYHILTRLEEQLKVTSFHRKEQYLHLLQYLRNSVTEENMKLPFVNAIYLMKLSQILLNEGHVLYAPITAPLIVKPCQELNLIPEFFRLFSSSNVQHYHERMWILYLLYDGLRESHDYRIYKKYYIFKILMSFANSVLCNYTSQFQILRILKRACEQKTGSFDLTRHCGIVSWINSFISRVDPHSQLIILLTEVIHTLWFSLLRKNITDNEDPTSNNSCNLPLPFVQEMQVVLLNLLQNYREGILFSAMKYFLPLFASVLHCKKQIQVQQKENPTGNGADQKNESSNDSESEVAEIKEETSNARTNYLHLGLTPRDVLLLLYQSRLHSSNVQLNECSLDLLKRCGYACNFLTEVSSNYLPKQTAEKSDSDENIPTELSEICQEDISVCSENERNKLRQAFVNICLEWVPSWTYQSAVKGQDSCFDETLELVMACLCEEAAHTVPLTSVLNILCWIETHLNLWKSATARMKQNTGQDEIPVLLASLFSLYTRLLDTSGSEESLSETNTHKSADLQKTILDALQLLSRICHTLTKRYSSSEGFRTTKTKTSVLLPYLKQIATALPK